MYKTIAEILALPTEELDKLTDDEWKALLAPLIPAARQPNKTYVSDNNAKMIEQLSKIFGI